MLENAIKNEDHTCKSKNEDPKSCKKKKIIIIFQNLKWLDFQTVPYIQL